MLRFEMGFQIWGWGGGVTGGDTDTHTQGHTQRYTYTHTQSNTENKANHLFTEQEKDKGSQSCQGPFTPAGVGWTALRERKAHQTPLTLPLKAPCRCSTPLPELPALLLGPQNKIRLFPVLNEAVPDRQKASLCPHSPNTTLPFTYSRRQLSKEHVEVKIIQVNSGFIRGGAKLYVF